MQNSFSKFTVAALTALLLFSAVGCKKKEENALPYITPVEGWTDIALPPTAKWQSSNISGKVENHYFKAPMGSAELFTFIEEAMEQNGWTLSKTVKYGRVFMKEKDQVEVSLVNEDEGTTLFMLLIEPEGAYGNK